MKYILLVIAIVLTIDYFGSIISDLIMAFSSDTRNDFIIKYLNSKNELSNWLRDHFMCKFFTDVLIFGFFLIMSIAIIYTFNQL